MQFPGQPDEGYSEDPLNPTNLSSGASAAAPPASSAPRPASNFDLEEWLSSVQYLPVSTKTQLAVTLLDHLPTSVVAQIAERLHPRLYIDFIQYLPPEVCLKILGYLDPVSLLSVARSCRGWYGLSLDRKLWERLYHMEGWQAIYAEIQAWEERENKSSGAVSSSVSSQHRVMASEHGHARKKRAISEEDDLEMPDADRMFRHESTLTGGSLFGSPAPSAQFACADQGNPTSEMDLDASNTPNTSLRAKTTEPIGTDIKGKGKAVRSREGASPSAISHSKPTLARSDLWTWDAPSARYKLNWKHVYTLRRRLESNWEQGKYVNFQLPRPDHPEEGHQECIYTLQFDSKYLVSGSRDRSIRVWSMDTRRLVGKPLRGHEGSVLCLQFDADPEEDLIVSGSSDSNVILWRFSTGEVIQRLTKAHTESVLNVKFDKRILVTCSKDKSIKVFNRRPMKFGDLGYNDPELINAVPLRIRDPRFPSPAGELPVKPPYTMIGHLEGHGAAVNAVQIYGNEVVSASGDRNIRVWDWPKQVCTRTVLGHGKGIACVQYDGRRIVSGSSDNEVKVFDGFSGLEVASLRAHTSLVRTVQAGFGDLPYSEAEDKAEAKKIDTEYLKALESGAIPAVQSSSRRPRPRNAGSKKLEDIMAYGANLPPGGGGGKYARIISGSYDQKIIIWRRDKDGVWQPAHRLRQEEAAEAAQQWAIRTGSMPMSGLQSSATPATGGPPPAINIQAHVSSQGSNLPLHPSASRSTASAPPLGSSQSNVPSPPAAPSRTTIENPIIATITPASAASFRALIDIIVPQGATALQQALASYPTMLAHQAPLQAAIAREPSPAHRAHLRQIVAEALSATQNAQLRVQLASMQTPAYTPITPPTLPPLSTVASPNSSMSAQASQSSHMTEMTTAQNVLSQGNNRGFDPIRHVESTSSQSLPQAHPLVAVGTSGIASAQDASHTLAHGSQQLSGRHSAGPQFGGHIHIHGQGSGSSHASQGSSRPSQPQPQAPPAPVQAHSTPVPQTQAHQQMTAASQQQQLAPQQQPQQQQQDAAQPAGQDQEAQAPHHPHLANTDNSPARVFKLQFDARRIICCSQTSVIVGWDFCNGDAELEDVARIFGTVE